MDKAKIEKLKIGDVLQDDKGVRYLVTKINWGESWIMAIDSHFRNLLISHDYAKVFLYYVESLDIKKVISFLQGHEWWNDVDKEAADDQ